MSVQCIRGLRVEQVFCSAPRPVVRPRDEAGFHRVREDVLDRVSEVFVVLDDGRRETVAEQVSLTFVPTVELLRVDPVHALHAGRERRERTLDDEVQVRVHQAPGDDAPGSLHNLACEQAEQEDALVVVPNDRGGRDAEDRDVVRPVLWKAATRDSRHAPDASHARTRLRRFQPTCHATGTVSRRETRARRTAGTVPTGFAGQPVDGGDSPHWPAEAGPSGTAGTVPAGKRP
jgi:hypothetical protein